jgi:hypothetical protein
MEKNQIYAYWSTFSDSEARNKWLPGIWTIVDERQRELCFSTVARNKWLPGIWTIVDGRQRETCF